MHEVRIIGRRGRATREMRARPWGGRVCGYELLPLPSEPPLSMPTSSARLTLQFPDGERSALVLDGAAAR